MIVISHSTLRTIDTCPGQWLELKLSDPATLIHHMINIIHCSK